MDMSEKVNQTIRKMVNDLRETGLGNDGVTFQSTPLKRSLSTNSNDSIMEGNAVKRVKRENSFSTYLGSPREVRRLRTELLEARNMIMNLENRITHMHSIRKEMQLLFDNETQSLKRQLEIDRKSIEELEHQAQTLRLREQVVKKELLDVQEKYDDLKASSEEQIFQLEKDLSVIKEESQSAEFEESLESATLKRKITELESILQAAQDDAKAQKKLASELNKQLSEKNDIERKLEQKELALQKANNHIKILENAKEDYLEFQEQAKSQSYKLARYVELEKENEKLKEDITRIRDDIKNKLLLEEEVHNLKTRVLKFKDMEKQLAEIQAQAGQTQLYLNEWRAVARGICEVTDNDLALPKILRATVERLQQQELTLTSEKVELESQLKTRTHEAKVARAELEKTVKLVSGLKTTSEQKKVLIHRMQKKLLLVTRERDSYRLQLDSYERDLTMVASSNGESDLAHSQKERIENLEKIIEGYRDLISKLENDLQNAQPNLYSELVPVKQEQMARLQDEVDKLKNENNKLREHKDRLEIQLETLMTGYDTLHGGQVIHLNQNPLSDVLVERGILLEQLQEENIKLKNKLKKMEEGVEISKIGDVTICPKEIQELKEQIKSNDKQRERLKDYFKSSMQDFRNVMYMLFGYKIDRASNSNIYKLRSMYAEHADDQLCFEVSPEGDLNLLENEFSSGLGPMIELHLMHQKSIPVFLSAITMDLFTQKTMTKTINLE